MCTAPGGELRARTYIRRVDLGFQREKPVRLNDAILLENVNELRGEPVL